MDKKLDHRGLSLRQIYSIDSSGSQWQQKKGILPFLFSFYLSLPLSSPYLPHVFWFKVLLPGRHAFPLLHQNFILDRKNVLIFQRVFKISHGLSKISRQRKIFSQVELVGPSKMHILRAFQEGACRSLNSMPKESVLLCDSSCLKYFMKHTSNTTFSYPAVDCTLCQGAVSAKPDKTAWQKAVRVTNKEIKFSPHEIWTEFN